MSKGCLKVKKKRFGGPSILKSARLDLNSASLNDNPEQPKRKRGQPKCSKNLPKVDEPSSKRPKSTMRERAEMAAYATLEEASQICSIC